MKNNLLGKILIILLLLAFTGIAVLLSIENYWFYTIITLIGIYIISYKMKIPYFALILFIVSFLMRLVTIFVFNTPLESDFEFLYQMSSSLLIGDMGYTESTYMLDWGYQIGFIFYQTILLKIFNSIVFLKIINCIMAAGITLLIYLILKEIVEKKAAKFTALLYMVYPHTLLLTTVLTNQHSSAFFIILGLYTMITKKLDNKINIYLRYVIVAVLIAIGNILRPEGIVFIFSIILFLICGIKKGNIKKIVSVILLMLVIYYTIVGAASFAFKATGLSKNGLENTNPLWKFVLGFNYETQGQYSEADTAFISDRSKELEVIKERTIGQSPIKLLDLFKDKVSIFWTQNSLSWSIGYIENNNINILGRECNGTIVIRLLANYNNQIYLVVFILTLIGIYSLLKRYRMSKATLFGIITLVYVGVYLLIEIQIRYTYLPRTIMFIIAGLGVERVIRYITDRVKNRRLLE